MRPILTLTCLFLSIKLSSQPTACNTTDTIGRARMYISDNPNTAFYAIAMAENNQRVYTLFQVSGLQQFFFVMAMDQTTGKIIWCKKWQTASALKCERIIISNSSLVIGALTKKTGENAFNLLCLVKMDTLGNIVWAKQYEMQNPISYGFALQGGLSLDEGQNEILVTTKGLAPETMIFGLNTIAINDYGNPNWGNVCMDDGSKIFYEVGMHKMRGPNSYYQLEIERPPETLSNNFYGLSVSQFSPLDMKQISGANFAPNINESLSSSFIGVWNFFDSKISMLSNGDYLGKSLEYFAPSSKNYYRHFFVQFNQQLQAQQGFIVSPPAGSRSLFARTNISVTGRIIFVNDNPDSSFTVAAIASGGLLNEQKFKKSIGGYTNSSAVTLLPNNNYFLMFNNNNGISTNTELYNQGPLIGADSCGSTLVKETSVTEVSVKTTPFKWDTIAPLNITQSPLQLTELPAQLVYQPICQTISKCDSLKIIAPDSICAGQPYTITIRKYGSCGKTVQLWFSLVGDTASYPKQVSQTGDTTYTLVSNGTGSITFLAKYIDCDIYADSKQITVGGSAIHLPVHDTTLCQGVSAIITAPNGYKSYSWNNGLSQNQSITISQPGVYYVSATPYCGIVSTDSIWVHFDSTQLAITSANVAVCLGDTASILLANGSLFYNIGWQPSQYTSFENNYLKCWPAQQTQYTVSATDSHNCNISTGFEVTILPDPIVEGLKDTYQKCDGDTIHITASANTFSRYLWSSGSTNNGITIKDTGTYWVSVTDTNNCGTKKYFNVKQAICQQAIYFPNAFTPNNDGRNDGFGATAYGILQQYNLTVWNRYGQKVFATTDISTKWNGMLKGQPLPIGTYIWECRYNFPNKPVQVQKGTVVMLK